MAFWDASVAVPAEVRRKLAEGILALLGNEWREWRARPTLAVQGYSDASLEQWCFMVDPCAVTDNQAITQWGFFPPELRACGIYEKEAYALTRLVDHITAYPAAFVARTGVDNMGVIGTWNKGFTLNEAVLEMLMASHAKLQLSGSSLVTEYIESKANPADKYTRKLTREHPFYVPN